MKVCSYWLLILVFTLAVPVQAEESGVKVWAASVGSNGLLLRRNLSDDSALLFGIYYSGSDWSSEIASSKDSYLSVEAGYRKYLGADELRDFIDGSVMYAHPSSTQSGNISNLGGDPVYTGLMVTYGLEKNLSESFTIEGSVGVRVTHSEDSFSKQTNVSFPISRVAVNYYF